MQRNMENIIKKTKGNINERFDMRFDEMIDLLKTRTGVVLAFDSFVFGYAQGMKAAKSEMRGKNL